MSKLEEMAAFFNARTNMYDEHMLSNVGGCREGYEELCRALPEGVETLLDLGCGTGLELENIYRRFPEVRVTGVDMAADMLAELQRKYAEKCPELIQGDYLTAELGEERYDAAVSFESLHHFRPEVKVRLYRRLWRSLKPGGVFVLGDYAAESEEAERGYFQEYARLSGGAEPGTYHYDTPLTAEHEAQVLRQAGFAEAKPTWRLENTVLIIARK